MGLVADVLTASNASWAWPTGVSRIIAEAIGGGGGGGAATGNPSTGGGGKGGSYAKVTVNKGAESTLNITVGASGTNVTDASANPGTASTIVQGGSTVLSAAGGAGGVVGAANDTNGAGATALNGSNIGTPTYVGGNGSTGAFDNYGSAGGGAAGPTSTGGAASNATGGTAGTGTFNNGNVYSGAGANGAAIGAAGIAGNPYGGAASGGNTTAAANRQGASGAAGIVVVTYTQPVLTSPTMGSITASGGTPSVATDVGSGTVYMVVVPDGDAPSVAQIKAGQQSNGTAALANQNQAVTATGTQTFSAVTGLSGNTAYEVFFVHTADTNDSASSTTGFSTLSADVQQALTGEQASGVVEALSVEEAAAIAGFESTTAVDTLTVESADIELPISSVSATAAIESLGVAVARGVSSVQTLAQASAPGGLADNYYSGTSGASIHPQPRATGNTWEGYIQVDDRPAHSYKGQGGVLDEIQVWFGIDGTATDTDGYGLIRVYTHAGDYGNGTPLNPALPADTPTPGWLAQSEVRYFDTSIGGGTWRGFRFFGANRIAQPLDVPFFYVFDWRPNDRTFPGNCVAFAANGISPSHPGNAYMDGSSNNGIESWDDFFRIYESPTQFSILSDLALAGASSDGAVGTVTASIDEGPGEEALTGEELTYALSSLTPVFEVAL